jgi:hypothetical protein
MSRVRPFLPTSRFEAFNQVETLSAVREVDGVCHEIAPATHG